MLSATKDELKLDIAMKGTMASARKQLPDTSWKLVALCTIHMSRGDQALAEKECNKAFCGILQHVADNHGKGRVAHRVGKLIPSIHLELIFVEN